MPYIKLEVTGNYLTVSDSDTNEVFYRLPKLYTYFSLDNTPSNTYLYFHILGGFGDKTKLGGFPFYSVEGDKLLGNESSNFIDVPDMVTYLIANTAG